MKDKSLSIANGKTQLVFEDTKEYFPEGININDMSFVPEQPQNIAHNMTIKYTLDLDIVNTWQSLHRVFQYFCVKSRVFTLVEHGSPKKFIHVVLYMRLMNKLALSTRFDVLRFLFYRFSYVENMVLVM